MWSALDRWHGLQRGELEAHEPAWVRAARAKQNHAPPILACDAVATAHCKTSASRELAPGRRATKPLLAP